jgi:hypothetical protein
MTRRRDERGATAVLISLVLFFVLFIAGAIAMDMGQIYAKRSALQTNADLAVLAAAAEIDGSNSCTAEALAAAEDYLTRYGNEVDGQYAVDLSGTEGDQDGYLKCTGWRVELWAPDARADFGMGQIAGGDGVDVPAFAAAEIKSPSQHFSLPMYAVSGCDFGSQQITDPPSSGGNSTTPTDLEPDTQQHNQANFTISSPNPAEVAAGTTSQMMSLSAVNASNNNQNLSGVTAVGFTKNTGEHYEVASNLIGSITNGVITAIPVPSEVLASSGVWWVRVYKDNKWSDGSNGIKPFTVGDLLFCNGAISGNFGTIKIARSDANPGSWLSQNIINGIEPVLAIYPGTTCDDGVPPAVTSEHSPNPGTNCLGTDPGFPNEEATQGLIEGNGGDDGRLDEDTTGNCSRSQDGSRTTGTPGNPSVNLNDDLLTCFIIDGSSIQDVVGGAPESLSADIFKSPRFFMIPVIPVEATNGSSNFYPIIDFRPGFITSQSTSATNAAPGTVDTYNGVTFQSGHVESLDVILFDEAALPEFAPAVGGEGEYTGSGTKVIVLVE